MSTTIRISTQLEEFIIKHGKFGETHGDVLERLLDISEPEPKKPSRKSVTRLASKDGEVHSQKFFRRPLVMVLYLAEDHQLKCADALEAIGKIIELTAMDKEMHSSGELRWRNNVQWARNDLVTSGIICTPEEGGRGIWKLTEKGVKYAKAIK